MYRPWWVYDDDDDSDSDDEDRSSSNNDIGNGRPFYFPKKIFNAIQKGNDDKDKAAMAKLDDYRQRLSTASPRWPTLILFGIGLRAPMALAGSLLGLLGSIFGWDMMIRSKSFVISILSSPYR